MRKKLIAGLAAAGILAGGGTAAAVITAGGPAAAASTVAATSSTPAVPASSPLGTLVANGTITQAQADAVQNALITYMRAHWQDIRDHWSASTPPMLTANGPLQTVLGQLVHNGTITQSQATAITNAVTAQVKAHWGNGPGAGYGPGMMGGYGPGMMGGPPRAGSSSS